MPADLDQPALTVKLLPNCQKIDRLALFLKAGKCLPDPLIAMQKEIIGGEKVGQVVIDLSVDENGAQHSFFRFPIVGNGLTFV